MLAKTLESPLDCKEIHPVHPKGNQSWVFIGRTDAETLILWPPDVKSWLIGKGPDAGEDWGQKKKGTTEDKIVGWHHWLNGHEFEWTLWGGDGQRGLACCSLWGHKVRQDWATELNWTDWTYRGNPLYLTADLSAETLKARREWKDVFKVIKEKIIQPTVVTQGERADKTKEILEMQEQKNWTLIAFLSPML